MTDLSPYQIVVPLFSLTMVAYAWNLVLRQHKTIWEGALWTMFWGWVGYVSLFPGSLQYLSQITGIKRNETAAVVIAIGILFFIVFYLVIRIEAMQQRLTKIVRDEALQEAGLHKKK